MIEIIQKAIYIQNKNTFPFSRNSAYMMSNKSVFNTHYRQLNVTQETMLYVSNLCTISVQFIKQIPTKSFLQKTCNEKYHHQIKKH